MQEDKVILIGKGYTIVDDPEEAIMVKIISPDGKVTFGFPAGPDEANLGGEGSGNYGHKGRPGQVGGSDDDGIPNASAAKNKSVKKGPRRYTKEGDINLLYQNEFAPWERRLHEDEMVAISEYCQDSYNEINGLLRGNELTGDAEVDERTEAQIELIDDALMSSKGFSEDTALYRGIDYDPEYMIGDTFLDKGFVSTSLNSSVAAENFALLGGDEGVLFEIEWPKGTPCGYTGNIAGNTAEFEVLLPRNVEFEVVNTSKHEVYDSGNDETYKIKVYHLRLFEWHGDY